jgi:hypothetical protein
MRTYVIKLSKVFCKKFKVNLNQIKTKKQEQLTMKQKVK